MNRIYLIWLAIHALVWPFAIIELIPDLHEGRLISIAIFLIILFILPLVRENTKLLVLLFTIQAVLPIIIFYPIDGELNPYLLLIQALIMAEAVSYLPRVKSIVVVAIQLGSLTWVIMQTNLLTSQLIWISLLYLLMLMAFFYYQSIHIREREVHRKNDALLEEYRQMKRQLIAEEELARQDERMLIGHEIHDSVGHKLTALLMQCEAFRLQAADQDKEKIETLKKLAEQSLEETRRAVKSFKQQEVGGLHGVIRLIRKLEIESFMKINFTMKHGAFAVQLSGEQSFAIYRAVQEALTNIMKHSSTREAQVLFEAPGGSIFRFEVINATAPNSFFQEGYGLKAMRERLEKVGGSLEIDHSERQFIVRGSIRIRERRG